MINDFKFLSTTKQPIAVFSGDVDDVYTYRFLNGDIIEAYPESFFDGINRIQYGPNLNIKNFRWADNFIHSQFFGAQLRSQNSEEYNGPINEFFAYYETRRNYPNRQTILPVVPVVFYIECNGHSIGVRHSDSFVFRNENTQVKIKYKKYQLNNENI
jgi:hypothetical protein